MRQGKPMGDTTKVQKPKITPFAGDKGDGKNYMNAGPEKNQAQFREGLIKANDSNVDADSRTPTGDAKIGDAKIKGGKKY